MDYKALRQKRTHHRTGDATKAVHEHEGHLHKGEKKTKIKLARGGVSGQKAAKRLDKPVRSHGSTSDRTPYKSGGRTKHKDKHSGTKVNVIVAGGGGQQPPMMPPHPPMPPAGMAPPPKPPMAPPPGAPPGGMMPPPGGAPGGMPPGMPPKPMMNRGGKVNTNIKAPKMHDGAGGGKGRKEKAAKYGATPLACGGRR